MYIYSLKKVYLLCDIFYIVSLTGFRRERYRPMKNLAEKKRIKMYYQDLKERIHLIG